MSTQNTMGAQRGPWMPMQWGATKQWMLLRDVPGTGGLCETFKAADGSLELFATEAEARAAIARATQPQEGA